MRMHLIQRGLVFLVLGVLASAAHGQSAPLKAQVIANPEPSVGVAGGGNTDLPPFAITWDTIDGGGGPVSNGSFVLNGTCGQPDPAVMAGGSFAMTGGYWFGQAANVCYPDCDLDNVLSINDFICFQTMFAIGDLYADCDGDLALSIDDFICFQTYFAIGC